MSRLMQITMMFLLFTIAIYLMCSLIAGTFMVFDWHLSIRIIAAICSLFNLRAFCLMIIKYYS